MSDSEKKIVRTSIRMDADLHSRLADRVHALKKTDRKASIDSEIQDAVRLYLDAADAPQRSASIYDAFTVQSPSPPAAAPEVHQLLEILSSANQEAKDVVRGIIRTYRNLAVHAPAAPVEAKRKKA